ncbi:hypothetical protein FVF58_35130 [Paraburkholderia panacisoli]|uniref:Uncharacterized protein n=1 Tax=Paraburkholderia panacisoli TaxID=2603818 RepID=A0A5B0GJU1_9BURK|nr:hypothetical protein [Paraburkholderia panacisoli]KAA1003703.1 hypothetical protein FVF58_35130 [Paraburkholderia panacisoli]
MSDPFSVRIYDGYPRTDRLLPGMPVAHTLHVPNGNVMPIFEAAERYRRDGDAVVLVAASATHPARRVPRRPLVWQDAQQSPSLEQASSRSVLLHRVPARAGSGLYPSVENPKPDLANIRRQTASGGGNRLMSGKPARPTFSPGLGVPTAQSQNAGSFA